MCLGVWLLCVYERLIIVCIGVTVYCECVAVSGYCVFWWMCMITVVYGCLVAASVWLLCVCVCVCLVNLCRCVWCVWVFVTG